MKHITVTDVSTARFSRVVVFVDQILTIVETDHGAVINLGHGTKVVTALSVAQVMSMINEGAVGG